MQCGRSAGKDVERGREDLTDLLEKSIPTEKQRMQRRGTHL
jgi:hypothetical protein